MPQVETTNKFEDIKSLLDIVDQGTTFVFNAFGVLNVGETLIKGADKRLNELRKLGCDIRIFTNAASYDHTGALDKFQRLGLSVDDDDDEIITSRDATLTALTSGIWGIITASEDQLADITTEFLRLGDDAAAYDAVDGILFFIVIRLDT
jgi:ribonucleotide monophosphatase NagD (HAD superfamily)